MLCVGGAFAGRTWSLETGIEESLIKGLLEGMGRVKGNQTGQGSQQWELLQPLGLNTEGEETPVG